MIKINLLGDDTAVDTSGRLYVAGYVASLLFVALLCTVLNHRLQASIEEKKLTVQELETQLTKWRITTKEVRDLEAKEKEYRDKLVVIATLRKNKTGPVRVMDDLNQSLPEKSWVTELREQGGVLKIQGLALDNQTIATFMEQLDTSSYFNNIELVQASQVVVDAVKLKSFSLQSNIDYLGEMKSEAAAAASAAAPPGSPPAKGAAAGSPPSAQRSAQEAAEKAEKLSKLAQMEG